MMNLLQQIIVPQENVNDETVLVLDLNLTSGDEVKNGDEVLNIETSKTVVELNAHCDGYIYYVVNLDDEVPVGSVLANIYEQALNEKELEQFNAEHHLKDYKANIDIKTSTIKPVFSNKALALLAAKQITQDEFIGIDFFPLTK